MMAVTPRLEDYLEALFLLETSGSRQTVTALAENLKLTKGTIATVIKKMAEQGLVLHESYGAIRLTPEGRRIGWEVYMKHERLTSFFHDFLGQDSERSEEIACLIEHHLDGAAANRFFNMIGFLRQAQAEKKEWTADLFSSLENAVHLPVPLTLMSLRQGKGRVCRLTGPAEMKHRLERQKIVLGTVVDNIRYGANSAEYVLETNVGPVSVDAATAATIWLV